MSSLLTQTPILHGEASASDPQTMPHAGKAPGVLLPGAEGYVVGIDLGGTKILAGLADRDGRQLGSLEQPTSAASWSVVAAQILSMTRALADGRPVAQLVLGVPAAVDPRSGQVSLSPNVDFGEGQRLSAGLAESLGCPVRIENDVNLAAFGETCAGSGVGVASLAFIAFGTGVGLGLVADGRIWQGHSGRAGEISYLPFGAAPHETAPASEAGLFEDMVGSAAIRAAYAGEALTVRDIFDRADQGDVAAGAVLDGVARQAALGLAAVQTLFDPQMIVLGGSIGVRDRFARALGGYVNRLLPYPVVLHVSRLGREAGLVGALHLAARELRNREGEVDAVTRMSAGAL